VNAPDGGPAFPGKHPVTIRNLDNPNEVDELHVLHGGMTLRDYFAAKAMQALITAATEKDDIGNVSSAPRYYAVLAYCYADEMIVERAKSG
jgi:hypothetical protein